MHDLHFHPLVAEVGGVGTHAQTIMRLVPQEDYAQFHLHRLHRQICQCMQHLIEWQRESERRHQVAQDLVKPKG